MADSPYTPITAPRPPAPPLPQALVDALATVSSLNTAMSIIQAIIGLPAGDTNAIVDTVREMLDVMQNLPEGERLVTRLSSLDTRLSTSETKIGSNETHLGDIDTKLLGIPAATQVLINTALGPIMAIIGSTGGDADSLVNTVREVLAVMSNFPEGVNLLTRLAGIDYAINNLRAPFDYDPDNPSASDWVVSAEGFVSLNKLNAVKGIVANTDALKALVTGMLNNTETLQMLKNSLGSTGSGGGTVTPTYPSIAGAVAYMEDFQQSFKGYRDLTTQTNASGKYYEGKDGLGWGTGANTGMFKGKIPVGGASTIVWSLPSADAINSGIIVSSDLTNYFPGIYAPAGGLGIKNGLFVFSINGTVTESAVAIPAFGPNTQVAVDVPATGNATGRYTTDGTTWTAIPGFSFPRPAVELAPGVYTDGTGRIYAVRATNLQPF